MSFSSIMSMWRSGGSDIMCEQLASLFWCRKSRSLMKHSSSFAWGSRGDRHDYYSQHQRGSQSIYVWNWKFAAHVDNSLLIQRPPWFQPLVQTAAADSSSHRTSPTPRGFTHPKLFLQLRATCRVGREDAVDVTVQLAGRHLCLSAQDVLHQSIVDENILLLRGDIPKLISKFNLLHFIRLFIVGHFLFNFSSL